MPVKTHQKLEPVRPASALGFISGAAGGASSATATLSCGWRWAAELAPGWL